MNMKKRPIKLKIERAERIICENIFTVERFIIENTDTFSNDLKKILKKRLSIQKLWRTIKDVVTSFNCFRLAFGGC